MARVCFMGVPFVLLRVLTVEAGTLGFQEVSNTIMMQMKSLHLGGADFGNLLSASVLKKAGNGEKLVPEEQDVVVKVLKLLNDTDLGNLRNASKSSKKLGDDACKDAFGACGKASEGLIEDIKAAKAGAKELRTKHAECRGVQATAGKDLQRALDAFKNFVDGLKGKSEPDASATGLNSSDLASLREGICQAPEGLSLESEKPVKTAAFGNRVKWAEDITGRYNQLHKAFLDAQDNANNSPNHCKDLQRNFEDAYCELYQAVHAANSTFAACERSAKDRCHKIQDRMAGSNKAMMEDFGAASLAICYLRALNDNDPSTLMEKIDHCKAGDFGAEAKTTLGLDGDAWSSDPAGAAAAKDGNVAASENFFAAFANGNLPDVNEPSFKQKEYDSLGAPTDPIRGSCHTTTTIPPFSELAAGVEIPNYSPQGARAVSGGVGIWD